MISFFPMVKNKVFGLKESILIFNSTYVIMFCVGLISLLNLPDLVLYALPDLNVEETIPKGCGESNVPPWDPDIPIPSIEQPSPPPRSISMDRWGGYGETTDVFDSRRSINTYNHSELIKIKPTLREDPGIPLNETAKGGDPLYFSNYMVTGLEKPDNHSSYKHLTEFRDRCYNLALEAYNEGDLDKNNMLRKQYDSVCKTIEKLPERKPDIYGKSWPEYPVDRNTSDSDTSESSFSSSSSEGSSSTGGGEEE